MKYLPRPLPVQLDEGNAGSGDEVDWTRLITQTRLYGMRRCRLAFSYVFMTESEYSLR